MARDNAYGQRAVGVRHAVHKMLRTAIVESPEGEPFFAPALRPMDVGHWAVGIMVWRGFRGVAGAPVRPWSVGTRWAGSGRGRFHNLDCSRRTRRSGLTASRFQLPAPA